MRHTYGRGVPVRMSHAPRDRRTSDGRAARPDRADPLDWDGNGRPDGLLPPRETDGDRGAGTAIREEERG
ncbi:hypothetical protein [Nocardiopsis sp. YSL2]|uniref:hypothetical protein n=1 Tax=Nocardiopsis sp. YSL2 TaxID=2939492 RepID=UPI0026F41384|nr:hypothetical protein [Nocardiopsis sp. YSL2]